MRACNFFISGPISPFMHNVGGVAVDHLLFQFLICRCYGDICDQSLKLSKIVPHFAHADFKAEAPKNFLPRFLSNYMSKFHGDRPKVLGDMALQCARNNKKQQ